MKTYHALPYQQLNLRTLVLLVLKGKGYPEPFLDTIRGFSLCNEFEVSLLAAGCYEVLVSCMLGPCYRREAGPEEVKPGRTEV